MAFRNGVLQNTSKTNWINFVWRGGERKLSLSYVLKRMIEYPQNADQSDTEIWAEKCKSGLAPRRVRWNFAVRLTRVTWLKETVWTKRKWKSYFWIAFSCVLRVSARVCDSVATAAFSLFCIIDCQPHTVWLLGCRNWLQHALLIIKILSGRTNLMDCHASPTATKTWA